MKKICVIGGSGFLGSHVCDQLSDAGYEVRIYDSKPSIWAREDQMMIVGNLLDMEGLSNAISGCDAVYNFAAIADLDDALNRPLDTIKVNILGNAMVLEACRANNVNRYILASSIYVHSAEGGFYRCSKHAAEQFTEEYQKRYSLDYSILRYGSLYGPRSDRRNGLWRIVKNALEQGEVAYEGDPESMREYIHVIDAAKASVIALGDEFKNQHLVFTGQEPMKVDDLLKMLAEILGIKAPIKFINGKKDGHYVRTPYSYQVRLGKKYSPSIHVDMGQGLLQLIEELDPRK
jgi:UDP-glucose 4-epimerase